MKISVIVPVYNGEKTIRELFRRISAELDSSFQYEVIFVYDCGKDKSWEVITELIESYPEHVKGFHLARNYGQHNAILYGIKKSSGDFIVTLDEDLQHDPAYLKPLIRKQQEGNYDVVYAVFNNLAHPRLRDITSQMLRWLLKLTVPGIFPDYSPYRIIRKETAEDITRLKRSYTFIDGYLGWVTRKFGTIKAKHFRRTNGNSSYSLYKLIKHAALIEIVYSPLKKRILFTALGLNFFSLILIIAGKKIAYSNGCIIAGLITGFAGLSLLLIGLLAEGIHYRKLRTNPEPMLKYNQNIS